MDSEYTMSEVVIPGVDGDLTGVLLRPRRSPAGSSTALAPAVIVLPEIDGFCAGTVAAARRLAAAGYVALALDLYAPYGSTPVLRNAEDTVAWVMRLSDRHQLSDLVMALAWLRDLPDVDAERIALVGFSIGGRYGMLLCTEPHGLRAVVAFYPRPWPGGQIASVALAPGEYVAGFGAPVCALFGADDELVPQDMVERFDGLLKEHPINEHPTRGHETHIFPGRHFFANESRPRRYVPESADAAWSVALDFLATHMPPPLTERRTESLAE